MKKTTIVCILALAMIAASGIANGAQVNSSVDGQYSQVMTAMNMGGTLSTEIVVGSTDLQNSTLADAANIMIAQQETSLMVGSGAQPFTSVQFFANDAVNVGPGGDNFHVGKYFAYAGTDMIVTSAEKPANLDNFKGGSSFHIGKHFAPSLDAAAVLIIT